MHLDSCIGRSLGKRKTFCSATRTLPPPAGSLPLAPRVPAPVPGQRLRPLGNSPRARGTSQLLFPVQVLLPTQKSRLGRAPGMRCTFRTPSLRDPGELCDRAGTGTRQGGSGMWGELEQQQTVGTRAELSVCS